MKKRFYFYLNPDSISKIEKLAQKQYANSKSEVVEKAVREIFSRHRKKKSKKIMGDNVQNIDIDDETLSKIKKRAFELCKKYNRPDLIEDCAQIAILHITIYFHKWEKSGSLYAYFCKGIDDRIIKYLKKENKSWKMLILGKSSE